MPATRRAEAAQQAALNRLRAASSTPLEVRLENGVLRFATLTVPVPPRGGRDSHARALWFLKQYRGVLRLKDPATELQLTRRSRDGEHVFFRRRHKGIPVFPGGLGVHFSGSSVRAVSGNYVTEIDVSPTPRISARRAEALAKEFDGGIGVTTLGDTSLRYVNLALLGFDDRSTHLAWQVNLTTQKAMYIDAHRGKLLYTSSRRMTDFDLELDTSNGNGPRKGWPCGGEERWFEESGPVAGASPDAEGFLAFNNIKAVDDYFRTTFARDAHDDGGEDIEVYVHVGSSWRDAQYLADCDLFEFGTGFPLSDVMAHEFTHGVDDNEAALEYENESGALDESFADIFGHFVDSGDWLLGEGTPGSVVPAAAGCSGTAARRDMANPPCFGDPDHYTSPFKMPNVNDPTENNDYGGVHTNSGINNKAAFLITDGGTHSSRVVSGIGQAKAEQLFYNVLTGYLGDSSKMIDARDGAAFYALMWAGAQQKGFTLNDLCQVRNAYAAVGLGKGDVDCDGAEDGTDTDNDGDFAPNASDNCPNLSNPAQSDGDGDGQGDVCDADVDGDTDLNANDNCDFTPNPDQADLDNDGTGDKCDDSDGDTHVDASDNCPQNYNYYQEDENNDGQGDVCDDDLDGDGDLNAADNCPLTPNPSQTDGDGDGVGNACDLCPGLSNPDNTDTDEDGLGNPCDTDDDDDGVLDAADNCPLTPNADQIDLDGNGVGLKCDKGEQMTYNKIKNKANSIKTKAPILIIPVPICPQCGEALPARFEQVVKVSAPAGSDVRILSSEGKSVADGKRGVTEQLLKFQPPVHGSSAFRVTAGVSPTTGLAVTRPMPVGAPPADGLRYYLVVTPPRGTDLKNGYDVAFEFAGGVRLTDNR